MLCSFYIASLILLSAPHTFALTLIIIYGYWLYFTSMRTGAPELSSFSYVLKTHHQQKHPLPPNKSKFQLGPMSSKTYVLFKLCLTHQVEEGKLCSLYNYTIRNKMQTPGQRNSSNVPLGIKAINLVLSTLVFLYVLNNV